VRLLCDEMLRGLGRWLRAAGHDTLIARGGTSDLDLLAFARAEGRILLTCDRELARLAGGDPQVVALATEAPDPAAGELSARLGIDWLAAPFSRCLLDNAALRPADGRRPKDGARTRGPAPRLPRMRPGLLARQPRPPDARPPRALAAAALTNRAPRALLRAAPPSQEVAR
jgi:predicted nuclease of predicted toxin-antitoxin system